MLTLYKPPRSRSENDSDSSADRIIPAGRPYLTKVNGQLVMARDKKNKAADIAVDLLGEAFGVKPRVIRKRSQSPQRPKGPLLIGGVPYVPQQQLAYTAPLPQQAFSSQSLVPYPPQQSRSFVLPSPSQKDFDQLQQFNEHFNKMVGHSTPNHHHHAKEATKTTIIITKHICAGCGRIRSKKYHQDHPLKEGDKPAPDFCRKCLKYSSSTSSGGGHRDRKKKGNKTTHKKNHKKHVEHSSDDESSASSGLKRHTKAKHHPTKKEPRRIPPEEYIIVEEEFLEKEVRRPSSRGRARERVVVEEYEVDRRPLSPLGRQSSRTRPRSTSRKERFEVPRKPVRPPKIRETVIHKTASRQSPSTEYRYVEGAQNQRVIEERVETYPRKIPVHFYDDLVQESAHPPIDHYMEHRAREPESIGEGYSVQEADTVSRGPSRREHFEERETVSSSRSEEARQRRRRERNSPVSPVMPPWEAPHVLHPRSNDDVIVVTERFEYRPKKHGHSEEDRRRQEYVDRATLGARARTNQFSQEEAAKYYHDDWSRVEREPIQEPLKRREYPEHNYRRERQRDAELSDSEGSYEYRRTDHHKLPQAPSPPFRNYESNKVENWQDRPPYPLSSDSEVAQHVTTRKGNAPQRPPSIEIPRGRRRITLRARPENVRDATDGETEKALIPSPRCSREWETERYVEEISVSDMTERERIAEGEARHVTFRDTPSVQSAHESWTVTSESWPVEAERSGSGWNDGFEKGGGGG